MAIYIYMSFNFPCPVVFIAQTLITLSPAANATLVFTQVDTNVGNGYDSSTGSFTVPVAGAYIFNVQFCAFHYKQVIIGIAVNSIYKTKMLRNNSNGDRSCRTLSYLALLKQGDKVQAKLYPNSNTGILFNQGNAWTNSFSGALLR